MSLWSNNHIDNFCIPQKRPGGGAIHNIGCVVIISSQLVIGTFVSTIRKQSHWLVFDSILMNFTCESVN